MRWLALIAIAMIIPLLSGCFTILSVTQVATTASGTQFIVEIEVRTEDADANAHYGIVGVLLPIGFTVDSVYFSGDFGPDHCVFLHPDSVDADPGGQVDFWTDSLEAHWPSGPCYEWRVYQSTMPYASALDTGYVDLTLEITAGDLNGDYNLGYFVSNAALDFSDSSYYDVSLNNALEVTDGMDGVDVTFQFNASTNIDTFTTTHFVEVRGDLNGATGDLLPGGNNISWGKDSDLELTNVGGDYWSVTFKMNPCDTMKYKFWTGFDTDNGTSPNTGWEGPLNPADPIVTDTRTFVCPPHDTTVPWQYYYPDDKTGTRVDQMWRPFEEKPDTISVYFRVNVAGAVEANLFDPDQYIVGVRGDDAASAGVIDWDVSLAMTQEAGSVPEQGFRHVAAYIPVDSVTIAGNQAYKWVADSVTAVVWEGTPNRLFTYTHSLVTVTQDTTLHWTWFNDQAYTGFAPVQSIITWRVSTEAMEALGLFDRGVGDGIAIRGPRGWGEAEELTLAFNPLLQEWTTTNESFTTIPGTGFSYKYLVSWDASRADTTSENYIPKLELGGGWEEPSVTGGSDRVHVFLDAPQQFPVGDFGFDRQFFAGVPANAVIDHDIDVTWNIDMTQATDQSTNTNELFRPGVDTVWVQWDGSMLALSQGFNMWDSRSFMLTDTDGDGIYSGTLTLAVSENFPNVWYQICYVIVYSTATAGEYVQNGGGLARGRRYYQFIHPDQVLENPGGQFPTTVWPRGYDLPIMLWTESNLFTEDPPDLTQPTGVMAGDDMVPYKFNLSQNYPNPFNPETSVQYELAKASMVYIKVYNTMGQEIKTIVQEMQNPGRHTVVWDGTNNWGAKASSGIYLLQMKAGDFTKVRKMTMLK